MKTSTNNRLCVAGMSMVLCAAAGAQTPGSSRSDPPPDPSIGSLLERIAELEKKSAADDAHNAQLAARLSTLEAERNQQWMTEQRADEIRSLVQETLADADTRASMQATGLTAGYDNGFIIQSSDGNYLLRTNVLFQERFVLNRQRESIDDKSRWGFENARTEFTLSGHVVQPDLFYLAQIELSDVNTGLPSGQPRNDLLQAFIGYDFGQGWRFQIGTFKAPLLREELVDPGNQLLVERSLVNYIFTGGYTDGLQVEYRNDMFHVVGSYNNGVNDAVYGGGVMTGGTSPIFSGSADYAFTFRGEWLLNGDWETMKAFDSPRGTDKAMMLGAAAHYQSANGQQTGTADVDLLLMSVDFSAQCGGFSAFAALVYSSANASPGPTTDTWGFVAQAGWYFSQNWELFARYEWANTDELTFSDINILTFGFNRNLANWNAKWTTDFGIAFDPVAYSAPITSWRQDIPGENKQVVVRSQFQIMF
jgi:hypothetical protein